jgi:hypothetical protein
MKEYIQHVIDPYVRRKKEQLGIEQNPPRAILVLDCWNVHKSQDFLQWMKDNYPHYLLVFVPARCTGEMQPCDLFVQRPFKHEITQQFNTWLSNLVVTQLKQGVAVKDISLEFGLKDLKRKTLEFCLHACDKMADQSMKVLVKEGIDELGFKDLLSAERQLQAIKYCQQNRIEIKSMQEIKVQDLLEGEVERDSRSYTDLMEIDREQEEVDDIKAGEEEYVPKSSAKILKNIISRRKTRSTRVSMRQQEDAILANQLQEEELQDLD